MNEPLLSECTYCGQPATHHEDFMGLLWVWLCGDEACAGRLRADERGGDDCDAGDMDGDAASALASAGFGTDEYYEHGNED